MHFYSILYKFLDKSVDMQNNLTLYLSFDYRLPLYIYIYINNVIISLMTTNSLNQLIYLSV